MNTSENKSQVWNIANKSFYKSGPGGLSISPSNFGREEDMRVGVPVVMNSANIHKDVGSIPGPAQWVKDLVLPRAVV